MQDTITIYYYTAWDGFAWQGCDEATAKSLQGYLEATRTLPKTSADQPPFGGAVPCKVAGQVGVAVYRYMTRLKGDLSGRDSLYIALAFIPLDVGCLDFVRLLELPQLNETQPGELHPEEISVGRLGLRFSGATEEPGHWLDGEKAAAEYRMLKGRDGLRRLASLFFSKYTQLGFLNAVFRTESGLDGIVSTQTYSIYPEVSAVAEASKALREARMAQGGVLPEDEVVRTMKEALSKLDGWCDKQSRYVGLREYYETKKLELDDDDGRLRKITEYVSKLKRAYEVLPAEVVTGAGRSEIRYTARSCADLAAQFTSLPVIDHKAFHAAQNLALEALRRSTSLLSVCDYGDSLERAESERRKSEDALRSCRAEFDRLQRESNRENERLRKDLDRKGRDLAKLEAKVAELKMKFGSRPEAEDASKTGGVAPAKGSYQTTVLKPIKARPSSWFPSLWDWIAIILGAVALIVLMFLGWCVLSGGKSGAKREPSAVPVVTNDAEKAKAPLAGVSKERVPEDVSPKAIGTKAVEVKAVETKAVAEKKVEPKDAVKDEVTE